MGERLRMIEMSKLVLEQKKDEEEGRVDRLNAIRKKENSMVSELGIFFFSFCCTNYFVNLKLK